MSPVFRSVFSVAIVLLVAVKSSTCFNLTVLHNNDVHSHFIEFNAYGGRCTESLAKEKKCYGGFARQVSKMKEVRANEENVIFLNGGDFYQGTVWYTLHKWQVVADLVNKLQIDVMSLGNHEFDDGLDGLFPLLKRLNTQVVVCNINSTLVPEFAEYVKPSVVLDVGGEKIGVIGYLTPETKFLSSTGALEFEDEVECIDREARRLVAEEGINKVIAVGHAGFTVDQDIAARVKDVDIVVGGHTNTFLYSGEPPSNEETQGQYPWTVAREDGSFALVVQDFAFGKFLGHLQVEFDDEGRILRWGGNPVLMDSSVPEDPETLELLRPYGEEVRRRVLQTVGRTQVLLLGDRRACRMRECNLGNVLADAALDHFIERRPADRGWNSVAIALWNSGSIRGSIDERINQGNITIEDILTAAPFGNTMCVVGLKGKHLKEVLEHSVKDYDVDAVDPPGSFLQVSGLRLAYDMSRPAGSRLARAAARCADCRIPRLLPLEDEAVYEMVVNTYLAKGGDGFAMMRENAITYRNVDELDIDIIINYVQKHSPIITGLEDRITILPTESGTANGTTPQATTEPLPTTTELVGPNEVTDLQVEETLADSVANIPKALRNVPNELTKILPFKL